MQMLFLKFTIYKVYFFIFSSLITADICAMDNNKGFKVTVEAPINIALIKYWGKRNEVDIVIFVIYNILSFFLDFSSSIK